MVEYAVQRTRREKLHIDIVRPQDDGSVVCLWQTEPSYGGIHLARLFEALGDLISRGTPPSELIGAKCRTFIAGKQDNEIQITVGDIGMILERVRSRQRAAAGTDSDDLLAESCFAPD